MDEEATLGVCARKELFPYFKVKEKYTEEEFEDSILSSMGGISLEEHGGFGLCIKVQVGISMLERLPLFTFAAPGDILIYGNKKCWWILQEEQFGKEFMYEWD